MSQHVVRNDLGIIYDKVGVSNRVDLALWYEARVHEGTFRRKGT
jgi:DNA-binding CsgD family transcriptional regulator